MDRAKSLKFLKEVAKCIDDPDRARNFDSSAFPRLFNQFDEDQNGVLDKPEMAVLIKKAFAKRQAETKREAAIK